MPREILALHTDGGSEFNGAFATLCKQGGFAHVCSPPYTQSKNGVVEGRIKLIKQLVRIYAHELGRCTASDAVYFTQFATSQINFTPPPWVHRRTLLTWPTPQIIMVADPW